MRIKALAAAALVLGLAACGRKEQPPAPPPPPAPAPAPSAVGPLSFSQKTPDAEVSLSLPPAVAATPALYSKLFAEGKNGLQAFADGAKGELAESRANGEQVKPYRQSLTYTVTAETPKLVGLQLATSEDTGTSPNDTLKGLIWDKAAAREVKAADLFARGADLSAADKALCAAVTAARKARGDCPKLRAVGLTLSPAATPGKAGGVTAFVSGATLGGGADAHVAIPLATIRPALAPAYAGEFAGS